MTAVSNKIADIAYCGANDSAFLSALSCD